MDSADAAASHALLGPPNPTREWFMKFRTEVKDKKTAIHSGYLSETHLFRKLEDGAIPAVRSPETARCDGALMQGGQLPAWPLKAMSFKTWRWAIEQTGAWFLEFDVKSCGLIPASTKASEFRHRSAQSRVQENKPCDLIIVLVEGEPDYVGLVPFPIWRSMCGVIHGTLALDTRAPHWLSPFMVHDDDLRQAVHNLFQAAKPDGPVYENPTTGVRLCGFRPSLTQTPQHISTVFSGLPYLLPLWDRIVQTGLVEVEFNPIAPLLCDFLLLGPQFSQPLRIEHKLGGTGSSSIAVFLPDPSKSPFLKSRQWHFLWIQRGKDFPSWFCVGRDEVPDAWAERDLEWSDLTPFKCYEGWDSLPRLLDDLPPRAPSAIAKAEQLLMEQPLPDGYEDSSLSPTQTSDLADKDPDETEDDEESEPRGSNIRLVADLHWLCDRFNQICCDQGQLVCLPLDSGHQIASYIFVEHVWTSEDISHYRNQGELPITTYTRGIRPRRCIPMRFQHFGPNRKGTSYYPFWQHIRYWQLPADAQKFLIIAAWRRGYLQEKESYDSGYLCLPCEFTTQMNSGLQPPRNEDDLGAYYFWVSYLDVNNIKNVPWAQGYAKKELRYHNFMRQDIDPMRFVFPIYEIYQLACKIMDNERKDPIRLDSMQGFQHGPHFKEADYVTTVEKMHQAMSDYGRKYNPITTESAILISFAVCRLDHKLKNEKRTSPEDSPGSAISPGSTKTPGSANSSAPSTPTKRRQARSHSASPNKRAKPTYISPQFDEEAMIQFESSGWLSPLQQQSVSLGPTRRDVFDSLTFVTSVQHDSNDHAGLAGTCFLCGEPIDVTEQPSTGSSPNQCCEALGVLQRAAKDPVQRVWLENYLPALALGEDGAESQSAQIVQLRRWLGPTYQWTPNNAVLGPLTTKRGFLQRSLDHQIHWLDDLPPATQPVYQRLQDACAAMDGE